MPTLRELRERRTWEGRACRGRIRAVLGRDKRDPPVCRIRAVPGRDKRDPPVRCVRRGPGRDKRDPPVRAWC